MKKCIHSIHDADCPHCLRDLYDMARHRIAALEARCRAVEEEYAEYRACDKPEAEAAEKRIAELEAALAQIAEDESINRGEMIAIASNALGSASETGADVGDSPSTDSGREKQRASG